MLNIFPQTLCSGDTIPIKLSFTNASTGAVYSLAGSTVGVTVKADPLAADTSDSDALYQQDTPGDATGIVSFVIPGLAAGIYWLDIKLWTSPNRTTVIPSVQFKLIQSVTARVNP